MSFVNILNNPGFAHSVLMIFRYRQDLVDIEEKLESLENKGKELNRHLYGNKVAINEEVETFKAYIAKLVSLCNRDQVLADIFVHAINPVSLVKSLRETYPTVAELEALETEGAPYYPHMLTADVSGEFKHNVARYRYVLTGAKSGYVANGSFVKSASSVALLEGNEEFLAEGAGLDDHTLLDDAEADMKLVYNSGVAPVVLEAEEELDVKNAEREDYFFRIVGLDKTRIPESGGGYWITEGKDGVNTAQYNFLQKFLNTVDRGKVTEGRIHTGHRTVFMQKTLFPDISFYSTADGKVMPVSKSLVIFGCAISTREYPGAIMEEALKRQNRLYTRLSKRDRDEIYHSPLKDAWLNYADQLMDMSYVEMNHFGVNHGSAYSRCRRIMDEGHVTDPARLDGDLLQFITREYNCVALVKPSGSIMILPDSREHMVGRSVKKAAVGDVLYQAGHKKTITSAGVIAVRNRGVRDYSELYNHLHLSPSYQCYVFFPYHTLSFTNVSDFAVYIDPVVKKYRIISKSDLVLRVAARIRFAVDLDGAALTPELYDEIVASELDSYGFAAAKKAEFSEQFLAAKFKEDFIAKMEAGEVFNLALAYNLMTDKEKAGYTTDVDALLNKHKSTVDFLVRGDSCFAKKKVKVSVVKLENGVDGITRDIRELFPDVPGVELVYCDRRKALYFKPVNREALESIVVLQEFLEEQHALMEKKRDEYEHRVEAATSLNKLLGKTRAVRMLESLLLDAEERDYELAKIARRLGFSGVPCDIAGKFPELPGLKAVYIADKQEFGFNIVDVYKAADGITVLDEFTKKHSGLLAEKTKLALEVQRYHRGRQARRGVARMKEEELRLAEELRIEQEREELARLEDFERQRKAEEQRAIEQREREILEEERRRAQKARKEEWKEAQRGRLHGLFKKYEEILFMKPLVVDAEMSVVRERNTIMLNNVSFFTDIPGLRVESGPTGMKVNITDYRMFEGRGADYLERYFDRKIEILNRLREEQIRAELEEAENIAAQKLQRVARGYQARRRADNYREWKVLLDSTEFLEMLNFIKLEDGYFDTGPEDRVVKEGRYFVNIAGLSDISLPKFLGIEVRFSAEGMEFHITDEQAAFSDRGGVYNLRQYMGHLSDRLERARGYHEQALVREGNRDGAAKEIQRVVRGMLARLEVRNEARREPSAVMLQSVWRGKKGRDRVNERRAEIAYEDAAGRTLQKVWRGHLGRKEAEKRREETQQQDYAAIGLQKLWRGHTDRAMAAEVREESENLALQAQRILRGRIGRKKVASKKALLELDRQMAGMLAGDLSDNSKLLTRLPLALRRKLSGLESDESTRYLILKGGYLYSSVVGGELAPRDVDFELYMENIAELDELAIKRKFAKLLDIAEEDISVYDKRAYGTYNINIKIGEYVDLVVYDLRFPPKQELQWVTNLDAVRANIIGGLELPFDPKDLYFVSGCCVGYRSGILPSVIPEGFVAPPPGLPIPPGILRDMMVAHLKQGLRFYNPNAEDKVMRMGYFAAKDLCPTTHNSKELLMDDLVVGTEMVADSVLVERFKDRVEKTVKRHGMSKGVQQKFYGILGTIMSGDKEFDIASKAWLTSKVVEVEAMREEALEMGIAL